MQSIEPLSIKPIKINYKKFFPNSQIYVILISKYIHCTNYKIYKTTFQYHLKKYIYKYTKIQSTFPNQIRITLISKDPSLHKFFNKYTKSTLSQIPS